MSQKTINNPAFNLLVEVSSGSNAAAALDKLQKNLEEASATASTTSHIIKSRVFGIPTESQTSAASKAK